MYDHPLGGLVVVLVVHTVRSGSGTTSERVLDSSNHFWIVHIMYLALHLWYRLN